jgi:hypothetical protein
VTARADQSVALPILLCGTLGGMVGGLNCCCWLVPGITGLLCVRWARNLRGDGTPVLGVGLMASLVSALLVATWGTALFLYLNDPARMGESQAVVEELLGTSGGELPMGMMALGVAGMGFVFTLAVGLVGAAIGSIGNGRPRTGGAAPGAASMSATRFLDPQRPQAATAATPAPVPPAPVPVVPVVPTVSQEPAAAEPAPVEPAAVEVVPEPVVAPRTAEPEPHAAPDWSRFQRPPGSPQTEPDLEVRSDELANSAGEKGAWEEGEE